MVVGSGMRIPIYGILKRLLLLDSTLLEATSTSMPGEVRILEGTRDITDTETLVVEVFKSI